MDDYLIRIIIYFFIIVGMGLHAETALVESSGEFSMSFVLMIWSIVPYGLIFILRKFLYGALFASATVFTFDFFLHLNVFSDPESSTSAMKLLFMPLWNVILILPLAFAMGALFRKIIGSQRR